MADTVSQTGLIVRTGFPQAGQRIWHGRCGFHSRGRRHRVLYAVFGCRQLPLSKTTASLPSG
jgi:hypothetical protein